MSVEDFDPAEVARLVLAGEEWRLREAPEEEIPELDDIDAGPAVLRGGLAPTGIPGYHQTDERGFDRHSVSPTDSEGNPFDLAGGDVSEMVRKLLAGEL